MRPASRSGKVPPKAVESFTRELANLLAGGVPLARSLALLRREASNPAAKQLWSDIHDDVVGGTALADALAKFPKSFSSVYVAMVRAGEAGGFLDVVLEQIADFRTREQDLKGKVKAAMVYPIILAFLAVGVVIFLLTFFIPQFSGIFAQFGANLPALTQFDHRAAATCVKHYGLFVVVAVCDRRLSSHASGAWPRDTGRRRMEMVMLATPCSGRSSPISRWCVLRGCSERWSAAGVPLVASLRVAREAIGNQTLADTVSNAIEEVQRGEPLSRSLAGSPRLFPPSVVEMIAVAEETAGWTRNCFAWPATYEADLDRQLRMLVAVAEPVMLFVMAGLIGTIVISMLLPVFNLQELVH